ncbi:hypothetical protein Mgra_00004007 [Meloidogyne graminicola]|uniref:Uncharacterized protein n=1 Tax=Meloidogyne graminicola TaxID=189291 RepID=A0A8S9ZTM4_9BILA|nr:hypothetical protein Mgra_00004007 [Meloidogyne graminicola]
MHYLFLNLLPFYSVFRKTLYSNILLLLFLFVFSILVHGELREKRQSSGIPVSSSGQANANGSNTDLSSSNSMWKNINGIVGANGTSSGKASGNISTNVLSQSNAMAGQNSATNRGNANAIGANSITSGMSESNVNGNNISQSGMSSGSATGKGNSQVIADNFATNVRGRAGATGNKYTGVDLSVGQTLNWGQVMYSLSAMSTAMGENNSQANLMLNGGSLFNPALSANAIMSGVNDNGGGNVFSNVAANATGMGNNSKLNGEIIGGINSTTGGSRLVGAESLTNSGSGSNINSFGNILMNGSGASNGGIWGNSSINPAGGVQGIIGVQGKSSGANKTVTVDDGIRGVNSNGVITGGIGRGSIQGSGNQNGDASSYVGANSGNSQSSGVVVGSKGESKSLNGTSSILSINDQLNLLNGTGMGANGTNNVYGKVTGQMSSVNGDTFMGMSQNNNAGNSTIEAKGGGTGASSALTDANLNLPGANGTVQSEKIHGSVDATGDKTNVYSISQLTNSNGAQSLFNNQKSNVQSQGQGQASSSNNAILKRKKREEENEERKIRSAEENNSLRQLLEKNGNEQIVMYL